MTTCCLVCFDLPASADNNAHLTPLPDSWHLLSTGSGDLTDVRSIIVIATLFKQQGTMSGAVLVMDAYNLSA